ncbi:lipoxygenase 3, chloroplastic-like protein [Tanacetum coccineum]
MFVAKDRQKVVKASLASATDFLEEEVKGDVDEALEGTRRTDILKGIWNGVLHNIPPMVANLSNRKGDFMDCSNLRGLYRNVPQADMSSDMHGMLKFLDVSGSIEEIFKFETPESMPRVNPVILEKLKVFPPAMDEDKLFILDYRDSYLPFLEWINAQEGRKAYGTRTIFFLTSVGTLKPIAIELSLPPNDSNIPLKQVLTPPIDATTNGSGNWPKLMYAAEVHQLIHHWLRVHACMEPFIIASHLHLSSLHPVYKLLIPHMRHTLAINAMARETLISAEGIIECGFTPGKYSSEMACAAYQVPDETKPHGLRLLIEDYPYANDGLLIWSAIQEMVQAYVTHFYPNENDVISDTELQSCKLNFGQSHFGAYVPNRPPLMRKLIPQQYDLEYASFIADPEGYFLASLPSLFQSTRYMAAIDIISAHSHEEEYLREVKDVCTNWPGEPKIIEVDLL